MSTLKAIALRAFLVAALISVAPIHAGGEEEEVLPGGGDPIVENPWYCDWFGIGCPC